MSSYCLWEKGHLRGLARLVLLFHALLNFLHFDGGLLLCSLFLNPLAENVLREVEAPIVSCVSTEGLGTLDVRHEVWQTLWLLIVLILAFLLRLINAIDYVKMFVLVRSLQRISVGTCVRALIERVEVWRGLATDLDLRVVEVVVRICSREGDHVEGSATSLGEVHRQRDASLQGS